MADSTDPFPPARREVLGLLLVLASLALLLASAAGARNLAREGEAGFSPTLGMDSGIDLERFLQAMAYSTSVVHVAFLVGGLALVGQRRWADAGRAGRIGAATLVPVGIVVSLLSFYGTYLILTLDSEGRGFSFGFGASGGELVDRITTASMTTLVAVAALYVAWCAFTALPVASSSASNDDDAWAAPDAPVADRAWAEPDAPTGARDAAGSEVDGSTPPPSS